MHASNLLMSAIAAPALLLFAGSVSAATCPTELKRDNSGYWYSDNQPGWKSHKATPEEVTLSPEAFGGAIYSPKQHRIACVYKASDGDWIALVSKVHYGISLKPTDAAQRIGGQAASEAWQFSKQHQDYSCGQSGVSGSPEACQFYLAE